MKKIKTSDGNGTISHLIKLLRVMKITCLFLTIALVQVSASTYSQSAKLTFRLKNVMLSEVFSRIEKNSEFRFFYDSGDIDLSQKVTVSADDSKIEDILNEIFSNSEISYEIFDRYIIVKTKGSSTNFGKNILQQGQKVVSGKVTSTAGTPLPGVTVVEKGTTRGTVTNAEGEYSLVEVKNNSTLQFSFIGLQTQEILVGDQNVINVVMEEDVIGIEEVVAIGYGTQKKVNLTGAVSAVSGDDLAKRSTVINPVSLLQGKIPGVTVTQNTGLPGFDGNDIQIRGIGTYGASNDPLILIDGVPGEMSFLNPLSIESVTVLKDAASAAVYGSRAANGVILVTTKDGAGADGKLKINYEMNYSIQIPHNLLEMVTNSPDYMRWFNLYRTNENYGDTPANYYTEEDIADYTNPDDPILYPSYDWASGIKASPTMRHDISISGGSRTRYNLLLGYAKQEGSIKWFDAEKYTSQFNFTSNVRNNLTAGARVGLTYRYYGTGESSGDYNYFFAQPPTFMPYLPDGSGRFTWRAYEFEEHPWNPYARGKTELYSRRYADIRAQLWFDYEIFKDFHWYTKGSVNYTVYNYQKFQGEYLKVYLYRDPDNSDGGYTNSSGLSRQVSQSIYRNLYSYVSYNKDFGEYHHLKGMLGYNWETEYDDSLSGYRTGYITYSTPSLDAGSSDGQSTGGSNSEWGIISGFGRISYDYDKRYLLEVSARYDGTSRMSASNRWGLFPSASFAWRLSDEEFMSSTSHWLSNAKVRAAWGVLGNQSIGTYPYQATLSLTGDYSFDNSSLSDGVAQTSLNNENISWEKTQTTNIGLDFGFYNKLSFSLDLYRRYTYDILRSAQSTAVLGLSTPTINDGEMQDIGFDLQIDYRDRIKTGAFKDFSYSIGFVASAFRNKTLKFGTAEDGGNNYKQEGHPWEEWYLLKVTGIFQSEEEIAAAPTQYGENTQPGSLRFKDKNGDGKITDDDRYLMGKNSSPDFTYGFNLSAAWKNFDFYCSFSGVKGATAYTDSKYIKKPALVPTMYQYKHAWTEENQSTTMIAPGNPIATNHKSTYFLLDKSFLRMKALQVGYTFPNHLFSRLGVSEFRVYVAGDNLLTFTKYEGMDPEGSTDAMPLNTALSFGCNLNF